MSAEDAVLADKPVYARAGLRPNGYDMWTWRNRIVGVGWSASANAWWVQLLVDGKLKSEFRTTSSGFAILAASVMLGGGPL